MNLVEVYLKDVIDVKEIKTEEGFEIVEVLAVWDCYGNVKKQQVTFLKDDWIQTLNDGYYLG